MIDGWNVALHHLQSISLSLVELFALLGKVSKLVDRLIG